MSTVMHATKLVVRDVDVAEQFYEAIGLKVVSRNIGGEGDVHQQQSWLAASDAPNAHILILTRFLELPLPARPEYPGEIWLCFLVPDVDDTVAMVQARGGTLVRAGEDQPGHQVRAAVVTDPEGHLIELVGPMKDGSEG